MKIALRNFVFLAVLAVVTASAAAINCSAPLPVPIPGQPGQAVGSV